MANQEIREVTHMTQDKYLTVAELSEYLHIHRTTIYRMLRQGMLPGFRIGSDWRFSLEVIEEWLRDQMKTTSSSSGPAARRNSLIS